MGNWQKVEVFGSKYILAQVAVNILVLKSDLTQNKTTNILWYCKS